MTPKTGTPLDDYTDEEIVAAARARYWQERADAATLAMVLLAWAAGTERREQRACEKEAR